MQGIRTLTSELTAIAFSLGPRLGVGGSGASTGGSGYLDRSDAGGGIGFFGFTTGDCAVARQLAKHTSIVANTNFETKTCIYLKYKGLAFTAGWP